MQITNFKFYNRKKTNNSSYILHFLVDTVIGLSADLLRCQSDLRLLVWETPDKT